MFIKYVQLQCECVCTKYVKLNERTCIKYAELECEYMYKVCRIRMWVHV